MKSSLCSKLACTLFLISVAFGINNPIFAQNAPSSYDTGITCEQAMTMNKPVVLEFYADWCGACRQVAPILHSVKNEYNSKFTFVNLNVDKPEGSALSKKYKVETLPSIFVANPKTGDVKFLNQKNYFDPALLKKELDDYLKNYPE